MQNSKKLFSTVNMIKISLLSVIAVLLMQFGALKLPMLFPSFLELDFSEVPALIAIMTVHPLAGIVVVILKNVLKLVLFQTNTMYAGEISNMLVSIGYILPLTCMIRKNRNLKRVSIGIVLGIITMTIMGAFVNYFIAIPMYAKLFMPLQTIIQMGAVINSHITNTFTLVIYAIIPFNIFKGIIVTLVSLIIIKGLKPVIAYFSYPMQTKS